MKLPALHAGMLDRIKAALPGDDRIEAFGSARCMFESNFPPDKQSCGYTELWNAFKRITSGASIDEKKALYSGTAARVYKMKTA